MHTQDKISEILKTKTGTLFTAPPTATVFEALELISRHDVGCVLVMDGPLLLGVFSEREYARSVALHGRHSRETPLLEVMRTPLLTISPDTRVGEAMRIMTDSRVRHLPVVSVRTVVGLLSMSDLVKWIMSEQERTIKYLESYITGPYDPISKHS